MSIISRLFWHSGSIWVLATFLGATLMMPSAGMADEPRGPRGAAWKAIEKALQEGKPKTAAELLAGIEQAAADDKAWGEAARAIATRVLADTGDRAADEPERLIRLAAAIDTAPPETRGVLQAIRANWTWHYFLMNRWRFSQRTSGAVTAVDLAEIATWDLPAIINEIRTQFRKALTAEADLQKLPVGEWSMLIQPGTMPDAYRPTVWDVVAHDALAFAASGERGLADPEDAFEIEATSPALGGFDLFRQTDPAQLTTDTDSPLLQTWRLFQQLLAFHANDADRTAFLAADLDRILWASNAAVDAGEATVADRKIEALEGFITQAGDHELSALARHALAETVNGQGDRVAARAIASRGAESHPASVGGKQCKNLITTIDAKELSLATERAWAAPWPVVRVTYRNLTTVHLRLAKADWPARLKAGKPHPGWLDEQDRAAILALPPIKTFTADLPATDDFQSRSHDLPVTQAFAPETLEPGAYWLIASHKPDFGGTDNLVSATLVWVSRLAIVAETGGTLAGHVVDLASGAPLAEARVTAWVREQRGNPQAFTERGSTTTDANGRYQLEAEQGREIVLVATAELTGKRHTIPTESTHVWPRQEPGRSTSVVLVTDRGIHRPGQIVFYKGIVCSADQTGRDYTTLADRGIKVTLRDANGREVARGQHTTNAFGSFQGSFPIPTGALPGRWMLTSETAGHTGGIGVQVEEYKRPKFLVELTAPGEAVRLGAEVAVPGRASTYTGLSVAGAKVRWRVEREMRFPIWCRWIFPWLPFDSEARKIARGTVVTDDNGSFTIRFPAVPDRGVPADSLPVFTYRIVADVTDAGGETRSDEQRVSAGYTDTEAALTVDDWLAIDGGGRAAVGVTIATTSLDGEPRGAAGTLTIRRLVQPAEVPRGDLIHDGPQPMRRPMRGRGAKPGRLPNPGQKTDPTDPRTWADGEEVFAAPATTDKTTGKTTTTASLPAGIYRATFTLPAVGDAPAVATQTIIEVIDPAADHYAVKRPFTMKARRESVGPTEEFSALVGTGYASGRVLVEITQAGKLLERFWTVPGKTQWPVEFTPTDDNRGGFTVSAWLVRDGRLHREQRVIDVPWTNKQFSIEWERFTRRLEPAAKEVWRARIKSVADPVVGPAAPAVAEMLAILYDQSLDALAPHQWPANGLQSLFRREWGGPLVSFTNGSLQLNAILGSWQARYEGVAISYREFRDWFGPPTRGGFGFGGVGGGALRMQRRGMVAMEMAAAPAMALADAAPAEAEGVMAKNAAAADERDKQAGGTKPTAPPVDSAPPPRKNLAETAFFLPSLVSDEEGIVTIEFTLPDTLTTWQFKGLAHDAALRSGTITDTCIAAKDLMVEPLLPRFLREGDVVQIPVKVSNTSTGRLSGTVRFSLADARTGDARDTLIDGPREQAFDLAAGESKPAVFTVRVADGTDVLRVLAVGTTTNSAKPASDGEESLLPVLRRRVPITETIPITIRGPGVRTVSLERLVKSGGTAVESQSLVVQAASNPAWYGVLALPSIMEQSDESTETLFTRLYANSLARHIVTRDPRIERIFAQWKGTDALESPLEKNTSLMQTLLAETPWVRDAVDEKEARARIALLFDATRADNEAQAALARLEALRNGDGGWPWFPGGRTCDSVSLGIIAGFGRLRAAVVKVDIQPALAALPWLDSRLIDERERALKLWGDKPEEMVLTPIGAFALYARSFFTKDAPPEGDAAEAYRWGLGVGAKTWMKLDPRRSQGHLAIALKRAGDLEPALSIIDSLKQRAVDADVQPGQEKENWQGMWWRDRHPGWWSWAHAPIETQSIMIEAFDEVAGDAAAVEALKAWLLSQKRTSRWAGSRATADAVAALFGRGQDLLASTELVTVTIGGEAVRPEKVEAGTGFFEQRLVRKEITPAMGEIVMKKPDAGLAWGGVHWQYLDDIANVPAAGREELAIEKALFVKRHTKAGAMLEPLAAAGAAGAAKLDVGDELVVRLVVTSDRDYEFLELSDHRPSLTEPVDVLSGWRFGDGAAWYLAIRDASTQMFFERLPRGTHVFEYSLRVAHRGQASSGFATIQSRYAPEFSAHSASIAVDVK
jgi:hypothetical protein